MCYHGTDIDEQDRMEVQMSDDYSTDIRPLVRKIGKPPSQWQRKDLYDLCLKEGIKVVNFRFPALDGKLKELRLPVNNPEYLERLLTAGERVDGSSLYPKLFETSKSDLYVIPVYRWAYLNPWADDELDIVCRFADSEGNPCADTPDNLLEAVAARFRDRAGAELRALAELEFYLFTRPERARFTSRVQRNYHQSGPYLHSRPIADEILRVVGEVTGCVKYCHSEVGYMDRIESDEPEIDGCRVEQYELEFDLMPIQDLGCWLTVARWLIREVADRHDSTATFLPKLDEGMAGNGMHIHLAIYRNGRNTMNDDEGGLSDDALRLIGGLLRHPSTMTAFGNTVAASYLRLVPGQEAPTGICWGFRNRASLIRVPLSFAAPGRLDKVMNPDESGKYPEGLARPTVEYRSPDGSAFAHLLLSAITVCVEEGVLAPESVHIARSLEIPAGGRAEMESFEQLPATAVAAAQALHEGRAFFEERGVPPRLIDIVIDKLKDESDVGLSEKLRALPAAERLVASRRLMHKDLHKH
jgi:glutamine synthetase